MKIGRMIWMLLGVLCLCMGVFGQETDAPAELPVVVVCPIEGMVDDGMKVVVDRAIREAKNAELLIFKVDTPGGRVDSAIEISKSIVSAPCKTVAYIVGEGAISAGALISYSCDEIIMAPVTNIGATAPVNMTGEDIPETMDMKAKSFLRARFRALGEEKGHNTLLAEAMVESDIAIWAVPLAGGGYEIVEEAASRNTKRGDALDNIREAVEDALDSEGVREMVRALTGEASSRELEEAVSDLKGPAEEENEGEAPVVLEDGRELICDRGELLTLSTGEAKKYGLAATVAGDIDEVIGFCTMEQMRKVVIEPTWSEGLYRWLTSPLVAGLLLLLGFGGLYLEIKTPGVGLPGLIGVIALAIFFGSHLVIGLADWIDLLLVTVGLALLIAEVFFIPGFGLAGVSGIACLAVGFYLSLTRVVIPQYSWDFDRLEDAGKTALTAFVSLVIFVGLTWKFFPKTPFARWLVLADAQWDSAGYTVQTAEQSDAALGLRGVSASMLRPAGRGRFGSQTYDVVTRGEFIEKGRPIVIIEAVGNRYVVSEDEHGAPGA